MSYGGSVKSGFSRWLAKNEGWLGIVLAAISAFLFSVYTGFYIDASLKNQSEGPSSVAVGLGWFNILLVLAVVGLATQAALVAFRGNLERLQHRSEGELLSQLLLETTIRLLERQRPDTIYRALVTVADGRRSVRRTVLGVNIRTDPELTVEVPIDFGISGQAYVTNCMKAGDLTDDTRNKWRDGRTVDDIWDAVQCVLAYPMLTQDGRAFGTVNFDSNKTLHIAGLDDRQVQGALGRLAEFVTHLMKAYSPNGRVRFPQ